MLLINNLLHRILDMKEDCFNQFFQYFTEDFVFIYIKVCMTYIYYLSNQKTYICL